MDINKIFETVKQHSENSKHKKWNLKTIETFIISFEKNSQAANEYNAKDYGNIIKDLVSKIQMRDAILLQNDERETEVLNKTLNNNSLKELFSKLYILVLRAKKQKKKKLKVIPKAKKKNTTSKTKPKKKKKKPAKS